MSEFHLGFFSTSAVPQERWRRGSVTPTERCASQDSVPALSPPLWHMRACSASQLSCPCPLLDPLFPVLFSSVSRVVRPLGQPRYSHALRASALGFARWPGRSEDTWQCLAALPAPCQSATAMKFLAMERTMTVQSLLLRLHRSVDWRKQ